jgi:hypothetical protein
VDIIGSKKDDAPEMPNTKVYRMVPLLRDSRVLDRLSAGQMKVVVGSLDDLVVISIPPDTSLASAAQIADTVESQMPGKHGLVVGHNTEFLAVEECTEDQRVAVLKRVKKAART